MSSQYAGHLRIITFTTTKLCQGRGQHHNITDIFSPDRTTDSQRLFMSLWPLCWQGGGLGEAAPELRRRLCSARLSDGG